MGKMDKITELVKLLKHSQDPDSDFDEGQLKKGIEVESEHTNHPDIAKAIAKAHLKENSRYYDYLEDMEKKMDVDKH